MRERQNLFKRGVGILLIDAVLGEHLPGNKNLTSRELGRQ